MNLMKYLGAVALLSTAMFAADVTGKWKGEAETPNGRRETTITLKAEGSKLTGTVSGRQSDSPISEGKVEGDKVSFTVVRNFGGNDITFLYKGKASGNEIAFEVSAGERNYQMTVKKVE